MNMSARHGSPGRRTLIAAIVVAAVWACAGCGSTGVTTSTIASVRTGTTASVTTDKTGSEPSTTAPPTTASTPAPVTPAPSAAKPEVVAPHIVWDPIPFGAKRKAEMTAYALRHYGLDTYKLIDPHVIVIHFTVTPDFQSTYNTFAPDVPDPELHELPGTCAHFVIDKAGVIHQLVPLDIMCRHTVGLNWTAIGIEHVGYSDSEVLHDSRQMASSLRLVRWLRCRYHIAIRNVIGHNESLTSPYHHENVPALRTQTHEDFKHADMQVYRRRLQAAGSCPTR
jgi:N-acetylmuramoyl-L-alanine amidase